MLMYWHRGNPEMPLTEDAIAGSVCAVVSHYAR
jgi:hypothetical protein